MCIRVRFLIRKCFRPVTTEHIVNTKWYLRFSLANNQIFLFEISCKIVFRAAGHIQSIFKQPEVVQTRLRVSNNCHYTLSNMYCNVTSLIKKKIIIIITPGQIVKRRMCTLYTSKALSQWAMMGKDEAGSINRVNYRRHDTFTCTVRSHLPHPHHRIGIITPDKLPGTIYRPRGNG